MKNTLKTLALAALVSTAALSLAENKVTVSLSNAEVLGTFTGGPQKLQLAYSNTIYWSDQMNTVANLFDTGYKYPQGSPSARQTPAWNMVDITMRPGETAEQVVAVYMSNSGTNLSPLLDVLKEAGTTRVPSNFWELRRDMAANGERASMAVSSFLANGAGFVGSVRIFLYCDSDSTIHWNAVPLGGGVDLGWDGTSDKVMVSNGGAAVMLGVQLR